FDQLLDCAVTRNSDFAQPLDDKEVVKVAMSVWKMQLEGRNRFGQHGAYVPLNLVRKLAKTNPDALALYNVLKAENWPSSTFFIANGMADTAIAVERKVLARARRALLAEGLVVQLRRPSQHAPGLYGWPLAGRGSVS